MLITMGAVTCILPPNVPMRSPESLSSECATFSNVHHRSLAFTDPYPKTDPKKANS